MNTRKGVFTEQRNLKNFFKKITKTDTCWIWNGYKDKVGYGRFWVHNKFKMAHRFSYESFKTPIPKTFQIDHRCRNTSCVNPDHLEIVTASENSRRGVRATRSHCKYGHEFTPDNINPLKTSFKCLICHNAWKENHLKNLREETAIKRSFRNCNERSGPDFKTHCIREHEFIPGSFVINGRGARVCLLCRKLASEDLSKLTKGTRSKNHCINGHEYTEQNTRINKCGYRICIACHRKTSNVVKLGGSLKDRSKCKNGHKYTEETSYANPRGILECRICRKHRSLLRSKKFIEAKLKKLKLLNY